MENLLKKHVQLAAAVVAASIVAALVALLVVASTHGGTPQVAIHHVDTTIPEIALDPIHVNDPTTTTTVAAPQDFYGGMAPATTTTIAQAVPPAQAPAPLTTVAPVTTTTVPAPTTTTVAPGSAFTITIDQPGVSRPGGEFSPMATPTLQAPATITWINDGQYVRHLEIMGPGPAPYDVAIQPGQSFTATLTVTGAYQEQTMEGHSGGATPGRITVA